MFSEEYLNNLREDFPMLGTSMNQKPLIYFDSAATALKPQCVIDAIDDYYSHFYGTVNRAVYELAANATALYQKVRKQVASFINAFSENEIVFTKGTTEALNLIANSYGRQVLKKGDEVLVSQFEHHANIVPWQLICEQTGAILKVIPGNEKGELILEEYEKLLTPKTKIVALFHISNFLGTINPLEEMIPMAHKIGAKVVVDGAQSAPHLQVDMQSLNADFFVFSGHKLFGPTGVGVLYGKLDLLNEMPPYQGGGDMIETVSFEKTTYQEPPLRFEAGTPMIAQVLGLGEAIRYVNMIGLDQINEWENHLTKYATNLLKGVHPLRIIGEAEKKASIISFFVEGTHALDIGSLLDLRGIAVRTGHHCAQPTLKHFGLPATVRVSFSFYNTIREIDQFVLNLQEIIQQMN